MISKKYLLFLAGIVWSVAGYNVLILVYRLMRVICHLSCFSALLWCFCSSSL